MVAVQITLRDIPNSPALENHVRKKIEHLQKFNNRMLSCHAIVEFNKKHKHQGKLYQVRLDATVPGKEIAITKKMNADVYIAVRDAFAALKRKIEDHTKMRKGQVKTHQAIMHGHILRMINDEGYGFIKGTDGNEYYFSLTNVIYPHFGQLVVGDFVEYFPIMLNQGFQAQHVTRKKNNKEHQTAA